MSQENSQLIKVGDDIEQQGVGNWIFDEGVAKTFHQHIAKSVPCYQQTQDLAVQLSDWFVGGESPIVYDIGCATGTTLSLLIKRHCKKNIHFVGIDDSSGMLAQARSNLNNEIDGLNFNNNKFLFDLHCEDALRHVYRENISLIYSLYTLQFIQPELRLNLVQRLYSHLHRRGALIFVDKVVENTSVIADIYKEIHWTLKAQSFEVSQIMAKAESLRGRLIPFTIQENMEMLQKAGFDSISIFFKWANWIGILAIK